jgi:hypothetical protein
MALTITSLCTQQIVSARNDPVVPTAAVAPTRTVTRSWEQPQACTPCHCACLAFLGTWPGPGSGLAGHLGSVCGKDSLGVAARPIYTTTFAVHFCRLLGGGQLHSNIQKTGRMSVRVPVTSTFTICISTHPAIELNTYLSNIYPAASLGFDPINPRWGQNKITNQDGDTALGEAQHQHLLLVITHINKGPLPYLLFVYVYADSTWLTIKGLSLQQ